MDEILDKTLHADLSSPSNRAKTPVPPRLEQICMDCLRPAPDDRIQTSGELIRELQEDW